MLRILHLGQWEWVLTSHDVWLYLGCETYGHHCISGINGGNVMLALREIAAAQGYRSEDCDELGDRPRDGLRNQLHDTPRDNQPIAPDNQDPPEVDHRSCAGIQRRNQLSQAVPAAHNVSGDDSNDRLIRSQNMAHIPEGLTREARTGLLYFVGCGGAFFPHRYRLPQALALVLEAAGADLTTLGREEWCCDYPLFAIGDRERAAKLVWQSADRSWEEEA